MCPGRWAIRPRPPTLPVRPVRGSTARWTVQGGGIAGEAVDSASDVCGGCGAGRLISVELVVGAVVDARRLIVFAWAAGFAVDVSVGAASATGLVLAVGATADRLLLRAELGDRLAAAAAVAVGRLVLGVPTVGGSVAAAVACDALAAPTAFAGPRSATSGASVAEADAAGAPSAKAPSRTAPHASTRKSANSSAPATAAGRLRPAGARGNRTRLRDQHDGSLVQVTVKSGAELGPAVGQGRHRPAAVDLQPSWAASPAERV